MKIDVATADITPLYLDSLGIIASLTKELKISDRIDKKLYNNDKRRKITPGKAVEAMILNTLGFSERALYLTPHFYKNKPVSLLLGENIKNEDLNAYTLGHALDEIAEYGCSKLFSELAFEIAIEKKLLNNINHVDTTTFSFHGNYNNNAEDTENTKDDTEPKKVHITYGYSKDKRPDLKQITLGMVMNSKINVPLWTESFDGNSSDKKTLQSTIEKVNKFTSALDLEKPFTWIADSALYNKNKLLKTNAFVWLTRIPHTLKESKDFLSKPYSSLKWTKADCDYEYTEKKSNYGGIKQNWLMYYSKQKYKKDKAKFDKIYAKEKQILKSLEEKHKTKLYKTEKTCKKSQIKIEKEMKYHTIESVIKKSKKDYKIEIKTKIKKESIRIKKASLGRFILGTNDKNEDHYKTSEILKLYKSQQNIERGFRFLKDPYFMSDTFYLKKEERISSLLMIMTLTLFVYNYGQEKLNKNLKKTSNSLPNQKGKEKEKITLKWAFKLMVGISILQINNGLNVKSVKTKMSLVQEKIVKMLCITENIYGVPVIDTS